jgi:DNA-binding NarL/FixJ family response regulator
MGAACARQLLLDLAAIARAESPRLVGLPTLPVGSVPIRIVIAAASERLRQAVRRSVNVAAIMVVAEVATADELRAAAIAERPDVVLVAMALVYAASRALITDLARSSSGPAVVVIGSSDDETEMIDALRAGAVGYVHRDVSSSALVREIVETSNGDLVLSRADAQRLVRHLDHEQGEGMAHPRLGLSQREAEVAHLLSMGQTAREIGENLGISSRTVEGHVAKICEKLGARNRADAVRRYIEAR